MICGNPLPRQLTKCVPARAWLYTRSASCLARVAPYTVQAVLRQWGYCLLCVVLSHDYFLIVDLRSAPAGAYKKVICRA